jgi:hypothetical protein
MEVVVIFQNEEDCESIYLMALSLWKTNFCYPHLVGSVIPISRLSNFSKKLNPKTNLIIQKHKNMKKI